MLDCQSQTSLWVILHKHAYFILSIRPPCTSEFSLYLDVLKDLLCLVLSPNKLIPVWLDVDQP